MVVRGGKHSIFLLCPLDRKPAAGLFEGVFEEQCREYCCLAFWWGQWVLCCPGLASDEGRPSCLYFRSVPDRPNTTLCLWWVLYWGTIPTPHPEVGGCPSSGHKGSSLCPGGTGCGTSALEAEPSPYQLGPFCPPGRPPRMCPASYLH